MGSDLEEFFRRWEWRLIHSTRGANAIRARGALTADAEMQATIDQFREALRARRDAARAAVASRAEQAGAAKESAERALRARGVDVPGALSYPAGDARPRIGLVLTLLTLLAVTAIAAAAAGAFLGLHAIGTVGPEIGVIALAAIIGSVAGEALMGIAARWALAIGLAVLALGAASAYLVALVSDLIPERRLLLASLFVIVAVLTGAIWAISVSARSPRQRRAERREVSGLLRTLEKARADQVAATAELASLGAEWDAWFAKADAIGREAAAIVAAGPAPDKATSLVA